MKGLPLGFWIVATGLSLAVLALMLAPLMRRAPASLNTSAGEKAAAAYKDQLAQVEAELAAGEISEAEAQSSRAEIGRRLLAAAEETGGQNAPAPRSATRAAAIAAGLAVLGGAAVYTMIGVPGLPDMPLSARLEARPQPSQAEMETRVAEALAAQAQQPSPETLALLTQLQEVLVERPDDIQGLRFLGSMNRSLGRFQEARAAQERVVSLLGEAAEAEDLASLSELMILAANGYVSPEASQVLTRTLQADPENIMARYYSGTAMAQAGRAEAALALWTRLWEETPPEAPWRQMLAGQISELSRVAGLEPPPGIALSGVDEDQAAAIEGMVEGLASRLAEEGGPPEDWARLIRSLRVMGQGARADAIAAEAQNVFAGNEAALEVLRNGGAP